MKPSLIVHGGAWRIDPATHPDHLKGVEAAAGLAWKLLHEGASALDVVEKAVMLLEDDPTFDSGVGSVLTQAGEIEQDAMIMDGESLAMGAVGAVQGIKNAIHLARLVMEKTDHHFIVGSGARQFALQNGLELVPQSVLTVERELKRFQNYQTHPPQLDDEAFTFGKSGGTVGAVAMDERGNIAAATSTGGTAYSLAGRVGDSPIVGSGTYADNETGGASATGHGEKIMRVVLAKYATDLIRMGYTAQQAAETAIQHMERRVNGFGGIIVLDRDGGLGFAHNTPHMSVAWFAEDGQLHTRMQP
jgi:L-asparaginase / beta-aspartyl-peptidase